MTLTIIGHGAVRETFNRHIALWESLVVSKGHWITLSPEDDPLLLRYPIWTDARIGKASHSGLESLKRLRWLLKHLSLAKQVRYHLIFEYDSFLTSGPTVSGNGLAGILFENKEPKRFSAEVYPNPPWLIDHASLVRMNDTASAYREVTEEGHADRWLAAIAKLARVPIIPYQPPGFSRGTITEADYPELEAAIKRGTTAFHGVKDKQTLDLITR
jgi:hypothetical protein